MRPAPHSPVRTRVPLPLRLVLGCLTLSALAPWTVPNASAQTTLNQTTCVSDTGNCVGPSGFIQDLAVNCAIAGAEGRVSTWLSRITDRSGPNRITISGTCNEVPNITGFNRLRIEGTGGAIMRGASFSNSTGILLKSVTITCVGCGNGLSLSGSSVVLDGVTVQVGGNGINLSFKSFLAFTGAPSVISGNGLAGITAAGGSVVGLANVTVSNNGANGGGGQLTSTGVVATGGSSVLLSSQIGGVDAPVDISGHPVFGILVDEGVLSTRGVGSAGTIHIHDNGDAGLKLTGGHATLSGAAVKIDGNSSGALQLFIAGGAILEMGGAAEVQGDVWAGPHSHISMGETDQTGGGMITGALRLLAGSFALLQNANSIGALTCDETSWWQSDGQSAIGSNGCPNAPTVTVNAGAGLSGGGALPLGGSITLNNTGVLSLFANAPLTSTGGQNPMIGITPNYFIQNGISPQSGASFNVSGDGTIGGALSVGTNVFRADTNGVTIGGGTPIAEYVSISQPITLPVMTSGACSTFTTAAVTGFTPGSSDTVALGIPSSLVTGLGSGIFLVYQAWETTTTTSPTITIQVCNPTDKRYAGGAHGNLRIDILKH